MRPNASWFLSWTILLAGATALGAPVTVPNVFSNGNVADAVTVNANFDALAAGHNGTDAQVVAALTPTPVFPAAGASVTSLSQLRWAGGGGTYRVEVDSSASFTNPFTADPAGFAVNVRDVRRSGAIITPGTWSWRVKATVGTTTYTSAARTFTYAADGASCQAALAGANVTGAVPDGLYRLDPDGAGTGSAAYSAYCDMTTNGGGWTLVWTKASPAFVMWSASFNSACATSTAADCASAVNPTQTWTRALWRFADDNSCWVQFDSRRQAEFRSYLNGANVSNNPTVTLSKGLNGATEFETGVAAVHYYTVNGISESHGASDAWLDLWNGVDTTYGYWLNEDAASLSGRKCLCGMCRNAAVWMLVK